MRSALFFLVLFAPASAWQTPQPNPQQADSQIRQRMAANLSSLPNYTCLETIDRTVHRQSNKKPLFRDRIHIEVAFIEEKEMFSWPGAAHFEPDLLQQLPEAGASGAGGFGGWTRTLFGPSGPSFTHAGECAVESRRGLRYNFSVPAQASNYSISFAGQRAQLPYSGYLCVDPDALEIMLLEVHAEQAPQPVAAMSEAIHYGRTRIGAADFLLPVDHDLMVTDLEGKENRTLTRFTGCRAYGAESSIAFDTEHTAAPVVQTKAEELQIPEGVSLELKLDTPINFEESVIGDTIAARLSRSLEFAGVSIPKGATVSGRILGLEQYFEPEKYFLVTLEFTSISFEGKRAQFRAGLIGPRLTQDRRLDIEGTNVEASAPRGLDIVDGGTPGTGMFRILGGNLRLSRGMPMTWKTQSPSPPSK